MTAAQTQLTFWSSLRLTEVHLAGLRCTAPALTALDLIDYFGGEAIDVLLRGRQATLLHLHEALAATTYRRSNEQRRQIVLESRENPWSPPERLAHRLLRDAGITGWVGNLRVVVRGHAYSVDIGFPEINLAVESTGVSFTLPQPTSRRTGGGRTTWSTPAGECCGSPLGCWRRYRNWCWP